jgi:hypothetical protein
MTSSLKSQNATIGFEIPSNSSCHHEHLIKAMESEGFDFIVGSMSKSPSLTDTEWSSTPIERFQGPLDRDQLLFRTESMVYIACFFFKTL